MSFLQLGLISVNMSLVKWVYFGVAAATDNQDVAARDGGAIPQATLHFIDGTQREFDFPDHIEAIRRFLNGDE